MAMRRRSRPKPSNRTGEQISVYIYHPERSRLELLAREMNWPRGRTINALIAKTIPDAADERAALADALVIADREAAQHGG